MLWIKTAICSHTSATVAGWHTVRNPVRADAPAFDARLARFTVSASHSLLRSSALHSMAVTGPFRHAQARFGMRQSDSTAAAVLTAGKMTVRGMLLSVIDDVCEHFRKDFGS
ncbi:MAG: hypothetical protein WAN75_05515 [Xanthobacteraceae bacterium]